MSNINALNAPIITPFQSNALVFTDNIGNLITYPSYAFHAALAAALLNATGDSTLVTVICANVSSPFYNTNSAYNVLTGIFTAPIAGYYNFGGTIFFGNLASPGNQYLFSFLTSGGTRYMLHQGSPGNERSTASQQFTRTGNKRILLAQGETIRMQAEVDGTTKTVSINAGLQPTAFWGSLAQPA
ncbi:MAG TPA: hypothetical protein PLF59_08245 [Cyclobacteriaceae bacterium]|nr:hypothetical protein [Cyclobacteriaceae bacterium]